MSTAVDDLCGFVSQVTLAEIPEPIRERARLILADTVAAIAAGSVEPEMRDLTARLADTYTAKGVGPSTIVGSSLRALPATAAFLNGSAGTFMEMDEGNPHTLGHPGIHVIPAALAVAEARNSSGADFLSAVILGYEVGARVGIGTRLRPAMHPHGTWGTVGAAASVARLAGLETEGVRETINVASSLCLGTSRNNMLQGGLVRNSYAGFSGQTGVFVHDLVAAGFTGEHDGLATIFGEVLGDSWDPSALNDELGQHFEVGRSYFKRHACCRYNHGALDLLEDLRAQRPFEPDEVTAVQVETYDLAAALTDRTPRNTLAGKFSLPFAIATTIINGHSGLDSFTRPRLSQSDILALAARVQVSEDPALTALLPGLRPARLVVELADGTRLKGFTETNRGDSTDPFPSNVLVEKYFELSTRVWSHAAAERIYEVVMGIEELGSVRELTGLMHVEADGSVV